MHCSRHTISALAAGLLSVATLVCLLVVPSVAAAAGPATVTVRVEGLSETKLPATQVTTTIAPVVKDGEGSCMGTSALGALQLATDGNWSGPWNASYSQYEIYSIEGESHPFESGFYWDFWINHLPSESGACEAQLTNGEEILFFPCSESAEECPGPLSVEAPASANVGEPVTVTVKRYNLDGQASVLAGASVTGGASTATTEANGRATVSFTAAGKTTLSVSAPESVRTEAVVCVHAGDDGTCGTTAPTSSSSTSTVPTTTTTTTTTSTTSLSSSPAGATPYRGPFAIVARATSVREGAVYRRGHAPRVLSGTVDAHAAVKSVSLRLRRTYGGRCYSYDHSRRGLVRARCGRGSYFSVAATTTAADQASFSYRLPHGLPPGRYVLDVKATDAAGNQTTLARGSSRIVFYVR